ncbi:hypothetical protein J5N97_020533 [Dioscorea zingiberensis]|uniref:TF-B3 domain-containing protein n=1 Tax=Dioscorea zingiberensis TaxID=325984 RepID=A0A9D5HDI4_9LILI|nr:hypothetical protein J5N97_020533 [Dioscorea zingiberensis]
MELEAKLAAAEKRGLSDDEICKVSSEVYSILGIIHSVDPLVNFHRTSYDEAVELYFEICQGGEEGNKDPAAEGVRLEDPAIEESQIVISGPDPISRVITPDPEQIHEEKRYVPPSEALPAVIEIEDDTTAGISTSVIPSGEAASVTIKATPVGSSGEKASWTDQENTSSAMRRREGAFQGRTRMLFEEGLVRLRGPSGNFWSVMLRMATEIGEFRFTDGWEDFARDHLLEEGDLLVFVLREDICFEVHILGWNGCQKVSTLTAAPTQAPDDVSDFDSSGSSDSSESS